MPGSEHLHVPHVGWAIEDPLLANVGGTFVLADVFLVSLAAPRALGEAAVRHGCRIFLREGVLRLFVVVEGGRSMCVCVRWWGHSRQRLDWLD